MLEKTLKLTLAVVMAGGVMAALGKGVVFAEEGGMSLKLATISALDEEESSDDGGRIVLNFQDTDIRSVIESMAKLIDKTFLLDPRVKGKVSVISSHPVPSSRLYDILLSTLRLHGFAVIESDGVTKIVPESLAKQDQGPVVKEDVTVTGDRVITQVYELKHVSAREMLSALKPLVGPNGAIMAMQESNTLLITDYASNVKRVNRIIEEMDKPEEGDVVILELKNISALDFIDIFEKVYLRKGQSGAPSAQGQPGGGQVERFVIVPETRTNRLIIRSDSPAMVDKVRELLRDVDIPLEKKDNLHVVNLRHADVKEAADTLAKLMPKQPGKEAGASPDGVEMGIYAHENTRSLIISAPPDVYNRLRPIIETLDVRRRQIFVEALIAELTTDRVAEFGVQWQSLRGADANRAPGVTGVGSVNLGPTGSEIGNVTGAYGSGAPVLGGLNIGLINGFITMADGTQIPNLMALATVLEADTEANILSTPTLLTLDNEEAKIIVGQNVPFITGSYAPSTGGSSNTVNPFQTIERKDIGLTLKIKPQISEDESVRLSIFQEVSSLLPFSVRTGAVDVVTNKRSVESTVLIQGGQIVVLGGLIQDNTSINEKKVPLLGDIPILGNLFKYQTRERRKTNLMVFLRPYVLEEAEDADWLTKGAYEYVIGEQGEIRAATKIGGPPEPSPRLPDLKLNKTLQEFEPVEKKKEPVPEDEPKKEEVNAGVEVKDDIWSTD